MAGKGPNRARVEGDVAFIALTDRHGGSRGEAMIDAGDLRRVLLFGRWHRRSRKGESTDYVGTATRPSEHVLLHRFILDAPPTALVDHRNGDGLDCRRENLRLCTPLQNSQNRRKAAAKGRSGKRGVYWDSARGVWHAGISIAGVRKFLGTFASVEEAERVAVAARKELMPFATD